MQVIAELIATDPFILNWADSGFDPKQEQLVVNKLK